VIDLNDSILTILTLLIQVETNRVKTAGVGLAYLHVTRWDQQFRKAALRG